MCDYSLGNVATRPAVVGDKLKSTNFIGTITRGFAEVGTPNVAVCLLPGSELAFDAPIKCHRLDGVSGPIDTGQTLARFRQVDTDKAHVHHDALEFPDGKVVLLTHLCEGQYATVLQLGRDLRAVVSESGNWHALPADCEPLNIPETVIA